MADFDHMTQSADPFIAASNAALQLGGNRLFGRVIRVVVGAGLGAAPAADSIGQAAQSAAGKTLGLRVGLDVSKHRCAFKVDRTLDALPNTATLTVWNLSSVQRSAIEELRPHRGEKTGVPVSIEAGYETTGASQIFLGDLLTHHSTKEGPDWLSVFESLDGLKAIQTARINESFAAKTSTETVLRAIVKALGIKSGNLKQATALLRKKGFASYPAGKVCSGSAAVHMTNFCRSAGFSWSIQSGVLQIQDEGKALGERAVRLSSSNGLVESPCVDQKGVLQRLSIAWNT